MRLIDKYQNLKLTPTAVNYLYLTGKCYVALDFAGYLMDFPSNFKGIIMAVSLNGQFGFFSSNPKKPNVSNRLINKTLKFLFKRNFLAFRDIEPFPEFEIHNKLPFQTENLVFVNDYFWSN